jgi:hypothetical protein
MPSLTCRAYEASTVHVTSNRKNDVQCMFVKAPEHTVCKNVLIGILTHRPAGLAVSIHTPRLCSIPVVFMRLLQLPAARARLPRYHCPLGLPYLLPSCFFLQIGRNIQISSIHGSVGTAGPRRPQEELASRIHTCMRVWTTKRHHRQRLFMGLAAVRETKREIWVTCTANRTLNKEISPMYIIPHKVDSAESGGPHDLCGGYLALCVKSGRYLTHIPQPSADSHTN